MVLYSYRLQTVMPRGKKEQAPIATHGSRPGLKSIFPPHLCARDNVAIIIESLELAAESRSSLVLLAAVPPFRNDE